MLSLYDIKKTNIYNKIWEYNFLNNKTAELSAILFNDITGNGQSELVLVLYTFGAQAEIYIFSTDNMIPNGKPDIYTFPNLKAGTKPSNSTMINWDGDKDYELLVNLSSPERKLLIFDYNINELLPVKEIGENFLSSTYGLIDIYTEDLDKDKRDDVIIYNNNQQPAKHTIYSNEKAENSMLSSKDPMQKIIPLLLNDVFHDIGLTDSGRLYSFKLGEYIDAAESEIKDILYYSKSELIILLDQRLNQVSIPDFITTNSMEIDMPSNLLECVSNFNNKNILCSNLSEEDLYLYQFDPTPVAVQLMKSDSSLFVKQPNSSQEPLSIVKNIPIKDTLFFNEGDNIIINIAEAEKIKSIETITRPNQIELDAQSLQFKWDTNEEDAGEYFLEYNITYSTNTVLEQSNISNNQLALNSVETIETSVNKHIIYINDVPKIIIENTEDTIKVSETFFTKYKIEDSFYSSKNLLTSLNSVDLIIDSSTISWQPKFKHAGMNNLPLYTNDGLASDTLFLSVFVDTTQSISNTVEDSLIATVNEEFLYQLPYKKEQQYELISAPTNMRVSDKGKIHWIPIMTQLDDNRIEMNLINNNKNEKYTLNIYVNAPPVIAYRPAVKETMIQNDSLIYNCQNFDMNINPELSWGLDIDSSLNNLITLNSAGLFTVYSDSLLDNYDYSMILSDGMREDIFKGFIYINDPPVIKSNPPNYLSLGDTLFYQLEVEDNNMQKPYQKNKKNKLYYEMLNIPINATFDTLNSTVVWVPLVNQIGDNNFNVSVTDSISKTEQEFSIFVNDSPNITSVDSLSIEVGDTLEHFFNASDLNTDSQLIYSIKTTIDELLFSGKAGKLTWVPSESDIGLHTLEINVSDGFSTGSDAQKLKIFVYKNPLLLNKPPSEAFVNIEYLYSPLAEDMFKNTNIPEDVSFEFSSTDSLFTGTYSIENNEFLWTPTLNDIGEKPIKCLLRDQYGHETIYDYSINILLSPCEPSDTLGHVPAVIDSIVIEKIDTVYIKERRNYNNPDNLKWKPKALGF